MPLRRPFTSENVGSILAIRAHVKRVSQRSAERRGFYQVSKADISILKSRFCSQV